VLLNRAGSAIRVLPSYVIDRIAAGEVIERPGSVVKELVENGIDAGARAVHVDIEGGGLERISVSDDGSGMAGADVPTALLRHATSKLTAAEDLFAIRTLGFRGEALSSIAAVSRLTLTTRRRDDDSGTRVRADGGEVTAVEEVGCPPGTTVDVRELFFNTPARRQFLKSVATEQAHVVDAATRVILGARHGGVLVQAAGRRLLDLPEDTGEGSRVRAALGKRVDAVYPFDHHQNDIRVSGYVTRPEIDRHDTRGLWFFVNQRFVRDRMLQRALLDGYRTMVERGRYPLAVVHIDLDPAAVDVNVHPQKLEVRFRDSGPVFRAVSCALAEVLGQTPWLATDGLRPAPTAPGVVTTDGLRSAPTPGVGAADGLRPAPTAPRVVTADSLRSAPTPGVVAAEAPAPAYRLGLSPAAPSQQDLPVATPRGPFSSLRPVGQVLGLYLVCEGPEGLVLIDQHAAHERVTYERMRCQAARGAIHRQPLLFPEPIAVRPEVEEFIAARSADLERLGFEVEPVGPRRMVVRTVPAPLTGANSERLLRDLLEELETFGELAGAGDDAMASVLSRCACHASVRAGDHLSPGEISALLESMDEVDFGANCPHGRPVYHRISLTELARIFHR
jgi:DNA mismatch repair protein MutL